MNNHIYILQVIIYNNKLIYLFINKLPRYIFIDNTSYNFLLLICKFIKPYHLIKKNIIVDKGCLLVA